MMTDERLDFLASRESCRRAVTTSTTFFPVREMVPAMMRAGSLCWSCDEPSEEGATKARVLGF
jgi:hypothetical protein